MMRAFLCHALLLVALALPMPAVAQVASWTASGTPGNAALTDCSDCGEEIGVLIECRPGTPLTAHFFVLASEEGGEGTPVNIDLAIGAWSQRYAGVIRSSELIGNYPSVTLAPDDRLLGEMSSSGGGALVITLNGRPVAVHLTNASRAAQSFRSLCSAAAARPGNGPRLAGAATPAQRPSSERADGDLDADRPPDLPQPPSGDGPELLFDVHADVVPVGKWPEGIAFDGQSAWVAESGVRRLARIDVAARSVSGHAAVGRLPVNMLATPDGRILAVVQTDQKLAQILPNGRKGADIRLADCPQGIAAGRSVWVLGWRNCSSDGTSLFEIDLESRRTVRTIDLAGNAFALSVGLGRVWVVHTFLENSTVSSVDPQSGAVGQTEITGARLHHIVADDGGVFAGGAAGEGGVVIRVDQGQQKVLSERIAALTAGDGLVVAVGAAGTIYVLTPELELLRQMTTDFGQFEPRAVLAAGPSLLVTTHSGVGEEGSLLVIDDWQPGGIGD